MRKGESLALTPFNDSDAWMLFTRLMEWNKITAVDRAEVEAAKLLLKMLNGLALGIRQMAALIKAKGEGVQSFLNRYRRGGLDDNEFLKLEDYDFSLNTVWQTAFNTLKWKDTYNNGYGYRLLGVMTYLAPDSLPNTIRFRTQQSQVATMLAFCKDEDQ